MVGFQLLGKLLARAMDGIVAFEELTCKDEHIRIKWLTL
jgi:hypothetical protein